ncbi:MAG: GNAT family N-acetyltransferase [Thalassobaculales bacterium]
MVDAPLNGGPAPARRGHGRLSLRFAEADDADAIADLCRELLGFYGIAPPSSRAGMIHALQRHAFGTPPPIEILLAALDEEVAGMLAFHQTFAIASCQRALFIQDLYVLERARGHGLGRALMRGLAAEAQARGCTQIDWTADAWNHGARGFYDAFAHILQSDKVFYRLAGPGIRALLR